MFKDKLFCGEYDMTVEMEIILNSLCVRVTMTTKVA